MWHILILKTKVQLGFNFVFKTEIQVWDGRYWLLKIDFHDDTLFAVSKSLCFVPREMSYLG